MIDKAFLSSDLFLLTLTVGLYLPRDGGLPPTAAAAASRAADVRRRDRLPPLRRDIGYRRYQKPRASSTSRWACRWSLGSGSSTKVGTPAEACFRWASPPRGLRGGRAERRLYRHGVWRRARDTQLDPPSRSPCPSPSVRRTAGRHRPVTSVVIVLRGIFRQYLRRVDPAPLRDAKRKGFCAGRPRHRHGARHRDGAVEGALSGLAMA